jgi:predicted nucleic acid-binding protein
MLTMAAALAIELVVPDDDLRQQGFLWTRCLNRVAAYDSFYLALAERKDWMLLSGRPISAFPTPPTKT